MRANDPEAFARLRDEHCGLCYATRGQGEVTRMMACDEARCTLRDPASLGRERRWVRRVLTSSLVDNPQPPDEVLEGFNAHIAVAGCATPSLARNVAGTIGRAFQASTLRGQLHAILVEVLAELAGDLLHANVSHRTQEELRRISDQARREWNLRQDDLIRMLAMGGLTIPQIQQRTGHGRDKVRKALRRK